MWFSAKLEVNNISLAPNLKHYYTWQLLLGVGTYGRGFRLKDPVDNGLYSPATNGIDAGPYTRTIGFWGYNEFCERMQTEKPQWTFVRVNILTSKDYFCEPH